VGLGAPHWTPTRAARWSALTAARQGRIIARATLDAIALQSRDVLEAMRPRSGIALSALRVDAARPATTC